MKKIIYAAILLVSNFSIAQWSGTSPMNSMRSSHVSVELTNGKILVAGGYDATNQLKTAELYNPSNQTWTNTQTSMSSEHTSATASVLNDGKVLVIGGWTGSINTNSCEIYDPATDSWSNASPLNKGRSDHSATKLQDGKILVIGGYDGSVNLNSCELYDPTNNTWTIVDSLTTGRSSHTATLLSNGKVFVAGGYNPTANFQINSTELYNPGLNSWINGPTMSVGRNQHAASLLPSGDVLISGGESFTGGTPFAFSGLTSVELYNATTNSLSSVAALPSGLSFHKQVAIGNYVLAIGGKENTDYLNGNFTSVAGTTYQYNTSNNSWTAKPMNLDGRIYFTATLSSTNKVYVSGGETDAVEVYDFPLSTNELNSDASISICPNPVREILSVNLGGNETSNLKIKDVTGRVCLEKTLQTESLSLDLKEFKTGVYFLEIEQNGIIQKTKFIKE